MSRSVSESPLGFEITRVDCRLRECADGFMASLSTSTLKAFLVSLMHKILTLYVRRSKDRVT